ncbi:endopeptidase La [Bdellovibrionota bacterium FG-1]
MDYPTHGLLPVLPVRNTVVFPHIGLPLRVGRPGSVAAVEYARSTGNWIVAVSQKSDLEGNAPIAAEHLFRVGTLCKIEKIRGSASEGYEVFVRGVARFKVHTFEEQNGISAMGETEPDLQDADSETTSALMTSIKLLAQEILRLVPADTEGLSQLVQGVSDPVFLISLCAGNLEVPTVNKQELLEIASIKNRALKLLELMQGQKEGLQVQSDIRDRLSQKMGKMQREAILREQIKTIREELGETDEQKSQDDYHAKIEATGMPEEVKKVALDEFKRFESLGNASPETHVIRNYLDLLCSLPWSKSAVLGDHPEALDLDAARASLEADHYGLNKIKKRIVQHLAGMKLKKSARGSILLFVGPPGVGKTSLGESIARALGRKFVRASLGGVRDDAEIRGHRRTYVGAMPGRIIQGIKRAGENNPVMMLDEIDKLGRGFQGDPAAALLEVLDPEQNGSFTDHYLDVPFDLSKVFFIATANTLESIPGPLLDRMEVIELSGYTTSEKMHIAETHLIPKQLAEFGYQNGQLEIENDALLRVITHYTREAGVRSLQREIAAICRAATEKVLAALAENAPLPVRIDRAMLEEILGQERFTFEVAERITPPGVVTGLAWTPVGGEILFVEASLMPGAGRLILTGQLGEVMKESAQIALSLVRSKLAVLMPGFEFEKKDLHIHVPAGAIPKDGPSAGVTLLATIASLFSGRSINPKLAMTGEITLRGAVTPVGGIKEKLIAAHRAGIERVLLPKRNERDLTEVPDEIKKALKIDFIETEGDVLRLALGLGVGSILDHGNKVA